MYWQDLFLRRAQRGLLPYPAHSADGWTILETLEETAWRNLTGQFARGMEQAVELAGAKDLALRMSTLKEPGSGTGPLSLLEVMMNLAVHKAYHLGRIVLLRQMLLSWPPQAGGDSW